MDTTGPSIQLEQSITSNSKPPCPGSPTISNYFDSSTKSPMYYNSTHGHSSKAVAAINSIRGPLADYQERRGIPHTEHYTFVNIVTLLCQNAYNAALTVLTMLFNLLPLLEGFLFFIRFTLDKLIEIFESNDNKEKAVKITIFGVEMVVIIFIMSIIFGLIVIPVWQLLSHLLSKIFMFAA